MAEPAMGSKAEGPPGLLASALRLGAGLAGSQALLLAATPLWSRQFAAADFAILGLWSAVAAVVSVLVSLRYETQLMLPACEREAAALYRLTAGVIAGVAGLLLLFSLAWSLAAPAAWQQAVGLAALGLYLPLAVLAGAASAWMGLGLNWLNRRQAYAAINRARLSMALTVVVLACLAGALSFEAGLWLAHGIGAAVGALITAAALRGSVAASLAAASGAPAPQLADDWRAVARRHRDAPLFLWPAALMDILTQQLPVLLALNWFGTTAAGQFTLAWRSLALPLFMASAAIGAVFFQRFARLADQPLVARQLLLRVWRWGGLGAVLLSLLMAWLAVPLFVFVFGPAWREAGVMAAWMSPMLALMALSSATSGSLLVLGGQRLAPFFGLALLFLRPLSFWLASRSDGDLLLALQCWALAEASVILIYNAVVWRRLMRRI